jgi:hypothetical protein
LGTFEAFDESFDGIGHFFRPVPHVGSDVCAPGKVGSSVHKKMAGNQAWAMMTADVIDAFLAEQENSEKWCPSQAFPLES